MWHTAPVMRPTFVLALLAGGLLSRPTSLLAEPAPDSPGVMNGQEMGVDGEPIESDYTGDPIPDDLDTGDGPRVKTVPGKVEPPQNFKKQADGGVGVDRATSWGLTAMASIAYASGGLEFPLAAGISVTQFPDQTRTRPSFTFGTEMGWLPSASLFYARPYAGFGIWKLTVGTGLTFGTESPKVFGVSPEVAFHWRKASGRWNPVLELLVQGNLTLNEGDAFQNWIGVGVRGLLDL